MNHAAILASSGLMGPEPSSNVRNVIWVDGEFVPTQIEEIYEAFDGDLDKAKAVYSDFTDGCATGMAMDDLTQLGGEIALGIPYTTDKKPPPDDALFEVDEDTTAETERPENHIMIVDMFGGAYTEQEAISIALGVGGDMARAEKLYKNLTDGYVSHITAENLIKAGKGRTQVGDGVAF
jgi:hypothetical protein